MCGISCIGWQPVRWCAGAALPSAVPDGAIRWAVAGRDRHRAGVLCGAGVFPAGNDFCQLLSIAVDCTFCNITSGAARIPPKNIAIDICHSQLLTMATLSLIGALDVWGKALIRHPAGRVVSIVKGIFIEQGYRFGCICNDRLSVHQSLASDSDEESTVAPQFSGILRCLHKQGMQVRRFSPQPGCRI